MQIVYKCYYLLCCEHEIRGLVFFDNLSLEFQLLQQFYGDIQQGSKVSMDANGNQAQI